MRIKLRKIFKSILCLMFAAWCSVSLFQTGFLPRSDRFQLLQQQQQQQQQLLLGEKFNECQPSDVSCHNAVRADEATIRRQRTSTSTTTPIPTAATTMVLQSVKLRQLAREHLGPWYREAVSHCSNNVMTLPESGFARLHSVILDPRRANGKLGGENLMEVLNQPEANEFWTLQLGTFLVLCPNGSQTGDLTTIAGAPIGSSPSHVYRQFLDATRAVDRNEFARHFADAEPLDGPVLAVVRNEYANLYHTVSQVYNTFANAIFFGIDPAQATILLIDGHPKSSLDQVWDTLFHKVIRMGQLKSRPRATSDLIWVAEGHNSPLLQSRDRLPLINHFREFFLSRHGFNAAGKGAAKVAPPTTVKNCTGLQVVLIWRHDYVAHPRNPQGRLVRKIANENEVLEEVRYAFPKLRLKVTGVAMASLSFQEQLRLISDTRVLIGMHGAGLTHAMFLPDWSGVVELFPDLWSQENYHFRSIASWRGIAYEKWVSGGGSSDTPTTLPRGVISGLLHGVLRKMLCKLN